MPILTLAGLVSFNNKVIYFNICLWYSAVLVVTTKSGKEFCRCDIYIYVYRDGVTLCVVGWPQESRISFQKNLLYIYIYIRKYNVCKISKVSFQLSPFLSSMVMASSEGYYRLMA